MDNKQGGNYVSYANVWKLLNLVVYIDLVYINCSVVRHKKKKNKI